MAFDMEKGLVGMGQGFLSGYSTLLTQKAEQSLEQKKQEATLQREKSLAKYKNDMLQTQKTTALTEQRAYDESLAKRTAETEYVTKDGGTITREAYDAMSPEQQGSLLSKGDYNIGMKEKENSMALDQAEAVTKRKYNTTKELTTADIEAKVDQTLASMKDKLGIPESQMEEFREVMILEGADTPSKLNALMKDTQSKLDQKTIEGINDRAAEAGEARVKLITEEYGADALVVEATKAGYTGNSVTEAAEVIRKKGATASKVSDLVTIRKEMGGSKSTLSIDKGAQAEEMVGKLSSAVQSGQVTIDEIAAKSPQLAEKVKLASGSILKQPYTKGEQYKQPAGPAVDPKEQKQQMSILEQRKNKNQGIYGTKQSNNSYSPY